MKKVAKTKKGIIPAQHNQPERSIYEHDRETIAKYAYLIWEHESRPDGRQVDHWHQAEVHLRHAAME